MIQEEKHEIIVEGLRLRGRSCRVKGRQKNRQGKAPFLILCHGIPGASQQDKNLTDQPDGGYHALANQCVQEGFAVFHFNFRGAGESEGNFDLAGWKRDLTGVLDYWEARGEGTFLIWGFSAGGAVSCCVAARDSRIKGLVMAASPAEFFSLFSQQERQLRLEQLRQRGIIRDARFPADSAQWLRQIYAASPLLYIKNVPPRPLLIIHGSQDELVPLHHAFKLYKQAGPAAHLTILPGAKHQLRRHPPAIKRSLQWLRENS